MAAAGPPNEEIPNFQEPQTTISPAIEKLLHEQIYVEDGIDYCEYKPIGPSKYVAKYTATIVTCE